MKQISDKQFGEAQGLELQYVELEDCNCSAIEKRNKELEGALESVIELMIGDCKYCKYRAFPPKCEGCFHGPSTCIESHWEFIALPTEVMEISEDLQELLDNTRPVDVCLKELEEYAHASQDCKCKSNKEESK